MLGLLSNPNLNLFMTSHKIIPCNTLAGSTQIYIFFRNVEILNKNILINFILNENEEIFWNILRICF